MHKTPEQRKANAIARALQSHARQNGAGAASATNLSKPISLIQPNEAPSSLTAGLVRFVEQPLFLASFGIIGGIVGVIYTPFLAVLGFCMVGAFRRAKVVEGRSWKIQVLAYVLAFSGSFGIVYCVGKLIKKAVHIPTIAEIVTGIKGILPPPITQINNVYNLPPNPPNKDNDPREPALSVPQLLVDPDVAPGKPLQLIVNMVNTTGRSLDVRFTRMASLMPTPSTFDERVKFEDEHWKFIVKDLAANGQDEQLPARSNGKSNLRISTPALNETQLGEIASGTMTLYFYNIFQDLKTKQNLVEICVFLSPKLAIQDCVKHNKP
jgi:hypothetical protein